MAVSCLEMGIHETPTLQHWNYFLTLEDDILRLSRYLELAKDNFNCYSMELARILFAAASEVDVVAKRLCCELNAESMADSITKYKSEILAAYPQVTSAVVEIPRYGLTLTPWEQWKTERSPLWWQAYNNVKHHRHTHFSDASLKHSLNAVAGLFIFLLFYYRDESQNGKLTPNPAIFRAGTPFHVDRLMWEPGAYVYKLVPSGDD